MSKKITFKGLWEVLKESGKGFSDDKITKLSASLAYYTVFSMGPLLIVIIFLASFFFGREAVEGNIYGQIKGFVGGDAAAQLQQIIKNASVSGKGFTSAIIGIVTLLVGATSMFAEMQDSINGIWGIKPQPKKGWLKMIKTRLLSFGIIGSLGFLLLVSLAISAVVKGLSGRLQHMLPEVSVILVYIINLGISLVVTTILFGVIFKVLPDAKLKWRDVLAGSIATALLFLLGQFGISLYLDKSNVGSTYGAAGSLVILLLWVYYSAIILYFGAEFTKAFGIKFGSAIRPADYAVFTKKVEVEAGNTSAQQLDKKAKKIENKDFDSAVKEVQKDKAKQPPPPPEKPPKDEGVEAIDFVGALGVILAFAVIKALKK